VPAVVSPGTLQSRNPAPDIIPHLHRRRRHCRQHPRATPYPRRPQPRSTPPSQPRHGPTAPLRGCSGWEGPRSVSATAPAARIRRCASAPDRKGMRPPASRHSIIPPHRQRRLRPGHEPGLIGWINKASAAANRPPSFYPQPPCESNDAPPSGPETPRASSNRMTPYDFSLSTKVETGRKCRLRRLNPLAPCRALQSVAASPLPYRPCRPQSAADPAPRSEAGSARSAGDRPPAEPQRSRGYRQRGG